jgi:hypothetical protein
MAGSHAKRSCTASMATAMTYKDGVPLIICIQICK